MKPPAPEILRKGSLIRVAGGPGSAAAALALSFVDLRFADGHVERWLGPGRIGRFAGGRDAVAGLVAWGDEVIAEEADSLRDELRMDFADVPPRLPGRVEVVVEWSAVLDIPDVDRPAPD